MRFKQRVLWGCVRFAILVIAAESVYLESASYAATEKYWELSPYRVKVHVAIDDSRQPQIGLGRQLTERLSRRIRSTIYPLWDCEVFLASGHDMQRLIAIVQEAADPPTIESDWEELTTGCDKRLYLTVSLTRIGARLKCRELDCTTRRWGGVHSRLVRQSSTLEMSCLELICEAFSPLATVGSVPDSETEVVLSFRGSDLPQQTDLSFLTTAGENYQPLMLRTNAAGEVQPDTIKDVSWTYLSLRERGDDGWRADVYTGTRRPFGVRRRGRIKHLALAMRNPVGTTRARFYSRHDPSQGLTGYQVFRREPGTNVSKPMGLTDAQGSVQVPPGDSRVTLLFLRSEGQLLAKVPIVPGAKALVEVPIADDPARLRAQAALTSLSEQLIDTVAMRNILIARVRDRLKNGKIDEAQQLFTELDNLPGLTHFNQEIRTTQNRTLNRSSDPKVQARIDKLFTDTRKLLGRFLSMRAISEVQGEITAARRGENS